MTTKNLRDELKKYITDKDLSQSAVSRSIGISTAALSQYLNDKYPGDIVNLEKQISNYLGRETEKENTRIDAPNFLETFTARTVIETARMCHTDQEMGVCVGAAGLGKTEALREYARRYTDAVLIETDPGMTVKALFGEIVTRLGINCPPNMVKMMAEVIAKLKGTGHFLMIDEAENLNTRALESVRRVHDKSGIGVYLVGMPRLIANLRGNRGEFAQLYSRISVSVNLNNYREMESKREMVMKDTEMIVAHMLPNSNGIWKEFHKRSGGNVRVLVKMIKRAQRLATINQTKIDADIVAKAADLLII